MKMNQRSLQNPPKVQAWARTPAGIEGWFQHYMRTDSRIYGDGKVPPKGVGLRLLEEIGATVLAARYRGRYVVPEWRIATPLFVEELMGDAIGKVTDTPWQLPYSEAEPVLRECSVPGFLEERVRKHLKADEIKVRSLGMLGEKTSALTAGLYETRTANNTIEGLMASMWMVIQSGFSPVARWFADMQGEEVTYPGILFNDAIAGDTIHAHFHTSAKEEIRGIITLEINGHKTRQYRLVMEPDERVTIPPGIEPEFIYGLVELAGTYSYGFQDPVALEAIKLEGGTRIYQLQHSHVSAIIPQERPDGLEIMSASGWHNVIGSSTASSRHIVEYTRNQMHGKEVTQLGLWLLNKQLGSGYILLTDSYLLSSEEGNAPKLLRGVYGNARAVVEYDGGVVHGKAPSSHFIRVAFESGVPFCAGRLSLGKLNGYGRNNSNQILPDVSLLEEDDLRFMPKWVADYALRVMQGKEQFNPSTCGAVAYELDRPLIVVAGRARCNLRGINEIHRERPKFEKDGYWGGVYIG